MDLQKAAHYFKLAADQEIAIAQFNYGHCLRYCPCDAVRALTRNPETIFLDWDWTVRIAGFGHSASLDAPLVISPDAPKHGLSGDSRYLAPECYDGPCRCASDVFAFGLILFEILAGRPVFPSLNRWQIAFTVAVEGARPEIPESVLTPARALIEDCWAADPDDRPTFEEIVDWLAEMQFRVTADVNSAKLAEFVKNIEDWEKQNGGE
jgi:serine/threonine protein kinase